MLHNIKELTGLKVGAKDGELGKIKDAYFDDDRWVIRHLIVDTGGWLSERDVLISPRSVRGIDWNDEIIHVDLTRQQVKDSPSIDTDRPVSRQHETDFYRYFGYPAYWEGPNLWGQTMLPYPWVGGVIDPTVERKSVDPAVAREVQGRLDEERDNADVHLRSCEEVMGYEILATDGSIGQVDDFVFDDATFAIRAVIVDTRKWLPGRHVAIPPAAIDHVSWADHEVDVKMTREAVKSSPEYDPSRPPNDTLERALGAAPIP